MHILRFTHSTELGAQIAEEERAYVAVESLLEESLGEPVTITARTFWPSPTFADATEKLVEKHHPDVVLVLMSTFPFNYPSVPLRLSRRYGRPGARFAQAGRKAGTSRQWGYGRLARLGRLVFKRVIGAEFNFEPEDVVASVQAAVARLVRRESVPVIISGPFVAMTNREWLKPAVAERRLRAVHLGVMEACAAAHVYFLGWDEPMSLEVLPHFQHEDRFHLGRGYQVLFGLLDAQLIAFVLDEQAGRTPQPISVSAALAEAGPARLGLSDAQAEAIRTVVRGVRFHSPLSGAHPVA